MSLRVVERVDDWSQQSFSGGYDALRSLASSEFSGVIRAGGAELYMTVGTIVDINRGTVEDFADASGTAYEAPHPALPLLAVMQEHDPDTRAQYYTEETPISEVDRTLADGGFTGFIELSENVLSGDYYLVYHGGESMSVAYVGESERLITDDEAFETADDEVGIFTVHQAEVEPIEIPEATSGGDPDEDAAEAAAAAETADAVGSDQQSTVTDEASTARPDTDDGEPAQDAEPNDPSSSADEDGDETQSNAADRPRESSATGSERSTESEAETVGSAAGADSGAGSPADTQTGRAETAAGGTAGETGDASTDAETTEAAPPESTAPGSATSGGNQSQGGRQRTDRQATASGAEGAASGTEANASGQSPPPDSGRNAAGGADATGQSPAHGQNGTESRPEPTEQRAGGGVGTHDAGGGATPESGSASSEASSGDRHARATGGDAADLETRAVPSLDPGQTQVPSRDTRSASSGGRGAGPPAAGQSSTAEHSADQGGPSGGAAAETGSRQGPAAGGDAAPDQGNNGAGAKAGAADVAELEDEIDRLETDLARATEQRDELEAELAAVREERDELQAEVDRLSDELRRLEEQFGAAAETDQRMTPAEAIEGTNLFVDYDSKGKATLSKAHGGSEEREAVAENLQLGVHTEFEEDSVAVGGQAFGEFLRETLHHRFAQWVVRDLLFEIRDTGHGDALEDLYDAIPEIRRVEFNGTVEVEYVEDGQEQTGRESFDVIFRHRMGDPLIVANLNDSRNPATGGMMESLVSTAERVGQTDDALAAAFLVTSSYFESEALETVSEATRSGILSRDSRASFVNLSRTAGYHLCLTAAREGNFHMEVPEL